MQRDHTITVNAVDLRTARTILDAQMQKVRASGVIAEYEVGQWNLAATRLDDMEVALSQTTEHATFTYTFQVTTTRKAN